MGEDDHSTYRDLLSPAMQEPLQLICRLVQLLAGRPSFPVGDSPLIHQVAVVVVFFERPVVTVDIDRGVTVLDFDRDQPARAEQNVVDLTTVIPVTTQEHPLVTKSTGEFGRHLLLTHYAGHED